MYAFVNECVHLCIYLCMYDVIVFLEFMHQPCRMKMPRLVRWWSHDGAGCHVSHLAPRTSTMSSV